MIYPDYTLKDLVGRLVVIRTHCNHSDYPTEYQTYDEAWDNLAQSLAHLRGKLGEARYAQLVEMATQAKAHYDAGYAVGPAPGVRPPPGEPGSEHIKLGSWLMQDMGQVVKNKKPYAYPKELYRWPFDPSQPEF
jgi:hypothetical protein